MFLNDKSLGKQQPDKNRVSSNLKHPPFTFKVSKFSEGKLQAKGFINGKEVVNHIVYTPKSPQKIKIQVDENSYKINKKANDVVFIHANIEDENGTLITDFSDNIHLNFGSLLL